MRLRAVAVVCCAVLSGCFDPGGSGEGPTTATDTNATTGPSSSGPSSSISESADPTTDAPTTAPGDTESSDTTTMSTSTGDEATTSGVPTCDDIECGDNQYCVDSVCLDPPDGTVAVPAGNFWMGCDDKVDTECQDDEYPFHQVYLDAYAIDRTEVTVAAYQECIDAGGCPPRPTADMFGNECPSSSDGSDQRPATCVNWFEADGYCEWRGARLPTEAEWEKAARGDDGRLYPWGDDAPTCMLAVTSDCPGGLLLPVGSKPAGASPFGALDMSGNAFEWVADWYGSAYYVESPATNPPGPEKGSQRVVRSGGPNYGGAAMRNSNRPAFAEVQTPSQVFVSVGFRCAATP